MKRQKRKTCANTKVGKECGPPESRRGTEKEEAESSRYQEVPYPEVQLQRPNPLRHLSAVHKLGQEAVSKLNSIAKLEGKRRGH